MYTDKLKRLKYSQELIRVMILEMSLDMSIPLLNKDELCLLKEMMETNVRYRITHYKLASKILNVSINELLSEVDLSNLIKDFDTLDTDLKVSIVNIINLFSAVADLKELKTNSDNINDLLK